jgi:adhesin/invasin
VGTTNASGQITGTLSSTAAGTKVVTATVNGSVVIDQTPSVVVNAGAPSASQSSVAATTPITASGGSSQSTITVTVRNGFGIPLSGATVALAATGSGNTLTQPVGTTNASGQITGTLSSTDAGTKVVTATVNGSVVIDQTPSVVVNP